MKAELVLIPCAARGHLPAALELARLLIDRSHSLRITVLLIKLPFDPSIAVYADSLAASFASECIDIVDITTSTASTEETNPLVLCERFIESHRSRVRSAVVSVGGEPRPELAGFVLDMACMMMSDVAGELGVPTYTFWAASAGGLALQLHLEIDKCESIDFEAEHSFPGFTNPVPGRVLPSPLFNAAAPVLLRFTKRIRESRGVVINTSAEIEPHALRALVGDDAYPPVYAAGPILHMPKDVDAFLGSPEAAGAVAAWLDSQPPASVLFLCFGSAGCFPREQIREIAAAVESSRVRFLWSLWQFGACPVGVLPEGFLERTTG